MIKQVYNIFLYTNIQFFHIFAILLDTNANYVNFQESNYFFFYIESSWLENVKEKHYLLTLEQILVSTLCQMIEIRER